MPESKTSKRRCKSAERQERCLELRLKGYSYKEISKDVGVTQAACYQHVKRALADSKEKCGELAEEIREMELKRLNKIAKALEPKVEAGDENAIRAYLLVMDKRAKYVRSELPPDAETLNLTIEKPISELSVSELNRRVERNRLALAAAQKAVVKKGE